MLEEICCLGAPKAIGPYCHAMRNGEMIITSGQIPINPETNELVTDVKEATRQVLNNLLSIVVASGGTKESIAKVDVFVQTLDDFAAINEVYADFFGTHRPARVLVQVAKLPGGAVLEASMIAFSVK